MYNSTSIQALIDRIGWADPIQPATITVSADNKKSDSGRYFNGFHKLATVENVNSTLSASPGTPPGQSALDTYLLQMKKDAVLKVLAAVFGLNDRANYKYDLYGTRYDNTGADFSDIIINRSSLFDESIGYQQAANAIELMATSSRSNIAERSAKEAYQLLKIELDGITDDTTGRIISKGIVFKLNKSIAQVIDILFPVTKPKRTLWAFKGW